MYFSQPAISFDANPPYLIGSGRAEQKTVEVASPFGFWSAGAADNEL
jgi:hypothetical protein